MKLFQGALTTVNMLSVSYGGLGKHSVDMTYEEAELGIKVRLPVTHSGEHN